MFQARKTQAKSLVWNSSRKKMLSIKVNSLKKLKSQNRNQACKPTCKLALPLSHPSWGIISLLKDQAQVTLKVNCHNQSYNQELLLPQNKQDLKAVSQQSSIQNRSFNRIWTAQLCQRPYPFWRPTRPKQLKRVRWILTTCQQRVLNRKLLIRTSYRPIVGIVRLTRKFHSGEVCFLSHDSKVSKWRPTSQYRI